MATLLPRNKYTTRSTIKIHARYKIISTVDQERRNARHSYSARFPCSTGPCGAHRYAKLPRSTLASPLSRWLPPLLQFPSPLAPIPTTTLYSHHSLSWCNTTASTTTIASQRSQLPTSTSLVDADFVFVVFVVVIVVVVVVHVLLDVIVRVVVLRRSKRASVVRARAHVLPRMRIERMVPSSFSFSRYRLWLCLPRASFFRVHSLFHLSSRFFRPCSRSIAS